MKMSSTAFSYKQKSLLCIEVSTIGEKMREKEKEPCEHLRYRFVRRDSFLNRELFGYHADVYICEVCGTVEHRNRVYDTVKKVS